MHALLSAIPAVPESNGLYVKTHLSIGSLFFAECKEGLWF